MISSASASSRVPLQLPGRWLEHVGLGLGLARHVRLPPGVRRGHSDASGSASGGSASAAARTLAMNASRSAAGRHMAVWASSASGEENSGAQRPGPYCWFAHSPASGSAGRSSEESRKHSG